MAVTMYTQSIPVLVRGLKSMQNVIDKAAAFCAERKIDESVLTKFRLFPDMLPLTAQVFIATDTAKGAAARLGGIEAPKFDDVEVSFAELKARIQKTLDFIQSVPQAAIESSADKPIELKFGSREPMHFTGHSYLNTFVLPNFYFHLTAAYAILRHNGVSLGKTDFLA